MIVELPVDVHPTSCPNPVNVGSNGLVPAAILGTGIEWQSAVHINPLHENGIIMRAYDSAGVVITKDGKVVEVRAVKAKLEDVATPFGSELECGNEYSCTTNAPDGIEDLALKFPAQGKIDKKTGKYLPGVADLLVGLATGETRCVEIEAYQYHEAGLNRMHGKDVIIVKGAE